VTLGRKTGALQVVSSGLNADDWVIVEGIQFVRPGSRVQREVRPLTPPAAEIVPQQTEASETDAPDRS